MLKLRFVSMAVVALLLLPLAATVANADTQEVESAPVLAAPGWFEAAATWLSRLLNSMPTGEGLEVATAGTDGPDQQEEPNNTGSCIDPLGNPAPCNPGTGS
jgi:hypothetical protein